VIFLKSGKNLPNQNKPGTNPGATKIMPRINLNATSSRVNSATTNKAKAYGYQKA